MSLGWPVTINGVRKTALFKATEDALMTNNSFRRWMVATFLAAAAALPLGCSQDGPSGSAGGFPKPTVSVAKPVVKTIVEWDRYTGRLQATREVNVQAKVTGYLDQIHFSDGQVVDKGQLLFTIEQRPFQSEVDRAEAAVAVADANKARAVASVAEAKARLDQATAAYKLAETLEARASRLRQQGAVPQEEVDTKKSEKAQTEADVEAAKAAIELAEAQVGVAEAESKTAKSQLKSAQIQFDYTTIESPIAGRVSKHNLTVGNLITGGSSGATLLTTVVSLNPIHAYFDANEKEYLKYVRLDRDGTRKGSRDFKNPVYLKLADEDGYPHYGHMDFVDNQLDRQTGTIFGRGIFPNEDEVLTPGLFATIRIPGSPPYDAVLVPDSALATDQTTQFVYVIKEADGKKTVERQVIEAGPKSLGLRIIRKGLDGSETIVIEGVQSLRPGAEVDTDMKTLEIDENPELPNKYEPWPREKWLGENQAPVVMNKADSEDASRPQVAGPAEVLPTPAE